MKISTGYIHDGYTIDGFIKGMEGNYPDVRFKFRPVDFKTRNRIFGRVNLASDDNSATMAQTIAGRVVEWDLKKLKALGSEELVAVELAASEVLRLSPRLVVELFDVVMGSQSPGVP